MEVTTEEEVSSEAGVTCGMEVLGQITSGNRPQDHTAFAGDTRVPDTPTETTLLEQLIADGAHGSSLVSSTWPPAP